MISDRRPDEVLIAPGAGTAGIPIWLAGQGEWKKALAQLPSAQIAWLEANGFDGAARKFVVLHGPAGTIEGVVLGIGTPNGADAAVAAATGDNAPSDADAVSLLATAVRDAQDTTTGLLAALGCGQ